MNTETIKELQGLLEAATKGEWGEYQTAEGSVYIGTDHDGIVCFMASDDGTLDANAALIVAAVNALPSLLARLEAAEKVVEAAKMMHPVNRSDRLQSALTTYDQENARG